MLFNRCRAPFVRCIAFQCHTWLGLAQSGAPQKDPETDVRCFEKASPIRMVRSQEQAHMLYGPSGNTCTFSVSVAGMFDLLVEAFKLPWQKRTPIALNSLLFTSHSCTHQSSFHPRHAQSVQAISDLLGNERLNSASNYHRSHGR